MRKIRYIFEHYNQPLSVFSFQDFIREVWEKKGNKTANGYIKIINRWLRFKGIEEMKYFKEYGSEFTIQYCSPEEVRKLLQVAKAKGPREYAMFSLLFGKSLPRFAWNINFSYLLTFSFHKYSVAGNI